MAEYSALRVKTARACPKHGYEVSILYYRPLVIVEYFDSLLLG